LSAATRLIANRANRAYRVRLGDLGAT